MWLEIFRCDKDVVGWWVLGVVEWWVGLGVGVGCWC